MRKNLKNIAVIFSVIIALTGCSGPDILDFAIPRSGYTVHKDIAYGSHPRQRLDVYVPEHQAASRSVIVFFHGGSWKKGDKNEYRFIGEAFASRGYIAVVANYRLYPEVYFPAFVEDGASALAWIHKNIGTYGGEENNIFLSGHSAGGYIAAMLTLDDRYIKAAGGTRAWIRGMIGIAGPYDFLPFTDPDVIATFSKRKDAETQPITFAGPQMPPMLLLTGDMDEDVLPRNSINLAAKLQKYHNEVSIRTYPDVAHVGIVLSLAHGFRSKAPALEDIDNFVRSHAD